KCAAGWRTTRASRRHWRKSANSTTNCCVEKRPLQSAQGRGHDRSAARTTLLRRQADRRGGRRPYEAWMVHADAVLADDKIVIAAYEALASRHCLSRTRGRRGFSAEVVVRLLVLKHARNWSYAVLEREVRANLIYRNFTGIGLL